MIARFKRRPEVEQKYPEVADVLNEIIGAINTQPFYIGNRTVQSGEGTPENKIVGSIGDLYLREDGSTSTTLYVKTSGTNTKTGWTGK